MNATLIRRISMTGQKTRTSSDVPVTHFDATGLHDAKTRAVDLPTVFRDFAGYWTPLLGGRGSAAGYTLALGEERREALRDHLSADLPPVSHLVALRLLPTSST
jgi:hypothetical protein